MSVRIAGCGLLLLGVWFLMAESVHADEPLEPMSYFPVDVGRRWNYEVNYDLIGITRCGSGFQKSEGRHKEWIEASDRGEGVVVRVHERRETNRDTARVTEGTVRAELQVGPDEILLLAETSDGIGGMPVGRQVYDPPVPVFESLEGMRERTEPYVSEGFGVRTETTVVDTAFETVDTPAGTFEDCLKVTTSGQVGEFEFEDGMRIHDVILTVTSWYAPGVGLVKEIKYFKGYYTTEEMTAQDVISERHKVLRAYAPKER